MDEKIRNLQDHNDKAHYELRDSLNKNWDKTRDLEKADNRIESKFNKWFWIGTGVYSAIMFYLKYFNQ